VFVLNLAGRYPAGGLKIGISPRETARSLWDLGTRVPKMREVKNEMRTKGIAVLSTLMAALMLVGATYALWDAWLYVDVTVETGNIGLEWEIMGSGKEGDFKEISIMNAYIDGDTLYVTVDVAYPCVTYWVDFVIIGTGSVPVHMIWEESGDLDPYAEVLFPYPQPIQIHLDDRLMGRIEIHFDNTAQQSTTYTYRVELHYGQYNEFAPI
jgi:hypothetical protein